MPRAKKRSAEDLSDPSPTKKKSNAKSATPRKSKASAEKLTADDFDASEVNLNERLTEPLLALAKEEMDLGNKFKGISLKNAALMLKKFPEVINSGSEALKLKGIGKSIAKKIDDIIANGSIQKSEGNDENQQKLANINSLTKVYGINSTLASSLVRDHNVTSVVDLVSKQDLLDKPAKLGLKYYKDFLEPVPRDEVERIVTTIKSQAERIGDIDIHEFGQYARSESPIEQIFVVVAGSDKSDFSKLVTALQESALITDIISSTDSIVKSVCLSLSSSSPTLESKTDSETCAEPAPKKMFSIPKFSQIPRNAIQTPNMFAHRSSEAEDKDTDPTVSSAGAAEIDHEVPKSSPCHRYLELRYCSKAAFPIFFTHSLGPASFFRHLQEAAQSKGYSLTAKSLRKEADADNAGKQITVSSEQDLFGKIGLDFVPYHERAMQTMKSEN